MKYAQSGTQFRMSKKRKSTLSASKRKWIWVVVILSIVIFIVWNVVASKKKEADIVLEELVVETMTESVVEEQNIVPEPEPIFEETNLEAVDGFTGSGIARRGKDNEKFSHIIVAELPQIDLNTQFFEGWLVKPGVVEFFSTGEMFPREDGKWGLIWEQTSEDISNLQKFSEVVITLEDRDGNPTPSADHVLEGRF